jgi:DNA-binding LytR/AlgR family response regulator
MVTNTDFNFEKMSDDELLADVLQSANIFISEVTELGRRGYYLEKTNMNFIKKKTVTSNLPLMKEKPASKSEIEKFKLKISGFNINYLLYIQTNENYIHLHFIPQEDVKFNRQQKSILSTMKTAMSYLTEQGFVRVSRFFAVNQHYAHYANDVIKLDNGKEIKIADSYRDAVEKAFGVKKEDKK